MSRTIKPVNNLTIRELEKFDIEKRYFRDLGINNWGIVTDSDLPKNFIKNVDWLYDCKNINNRPNIDDNLIQKSAPKLNEALKSEELGLSNIALKYDGIFGLEEGSCLFIIKYLLANKVWYTDLNELINPVNKLEIFTSSEETKHSKWGA